jgi:hypothetical protein
VELHTKNALRAKSMEERQWADRCTHGVRLVCESLTGASKGRRGLQGFVKLKPSQIHQVLDLLLLRYGLGSWQRTPKTLDILLAEDQDISDWIQELKSKNRLQTLLLETQGGVPQQSPKKPANKKSKNPKAKPSAGEVLPKAKPAGGQNNQQAAAAKPQKQKRPSK